MVCMRADAGQPELVGGCGPWTGADLQALTGPQAEQALAQVEACGCDPALPLASPNRGALLHDVGKIGVPDQALLEPGSLSEEQWQAVRKNAEVSYRVLAAVDFLQGAARWPTRTTPPGAIAAGRAARDRTLRRQPLRSRAGGDLLPRVCRDRAAAGGLALWRRGRFQVAHCP